MPGGQEMKMDGSEDMMKLIAFFEVLSFLILGPIQTPKFLHLPEDRLKPSSCSYFSVILMVESRSNHTVAVTFNST